MSDGMAFLTGAAFAGVAALFMLKGGGNLGATNITAPQPLPISPTNPVNPYATASPMPTAGIPGSTAYGTEQQRLDAERLRAMFEQQRTETEQLKAQLQNQQLLIERLTAQNDQNQNSSLFAARNKPPATAVVANQQQDNPMLSGIVWALGGMAITVSGGVVVLGALSVLSRQQRPPRTTYVVQQPYPALPHTLQARRRAEVVPPQMDDRQVDYVEYDR